MKDYVGALVAIAAGILSWLVGGFDTPILALLICMGADYVTGLIVAGVFHASPKTSGGGLDSQVGWKGLARKFVTLLIVVVANLADLMLELGYIRDAVIAGFCANECISILENAGLMGIRIPQSLRAALEKLSQEAEHDR
ncbi:MAG: phage holin family protein [Oscillospiraceae bacterium]|nr:phage holin family protein [Oscillospiraceae bacterium]